MIPAEVKGVIASKQGLSCAGYFRLSARTAHLRQRIYVTVRDGGNLFMPVAAHEHFPITEIENYYLGRVRYGYDESIGRGGGEVVFSIEGRNSRAAEEGALIIERELVELEFVLNEPRLSRWAAALPEKVRYLSIARTPALPPAYRPERLPERPGVPVAVSEAEKRGRRARTTTLGELFTDAAEPRPEPPKAMPRRAMTLAEWTLSGPASPGRRPGSLMAAAMRTNPEALAKTKEGGMWK